MLLAGLLAAVGSVSLAGVEGLELGVEERQREGHFPPRAVLAVFGQLVKQDFLVVKAGLLQVFVAAVGLGIGQGLEVPQAVAAVWQVREQTLEGPP